MTSRVQSSYSELITYRHGTFAIDKITWKYRKTANVIEKNFCIVSHIENSKNDEGYITKKHVDILTRCSK